MKRCKKFFIIIMPAILAAIFYTAGYFYKNFINNFFKMPCIFHMLTGYYCCGCGGTRSFYALLNGNFVESFKYNPIVIFGVFLFILKWIELISGKKIIPGNDILFYIITGIFLIFYIIRNFIPALAPV